MEIDTKEKWQVMCRRNIIKSELVGKFEDTSIKLLSLSYLLVKSFFSCRNLVVVVFQVFKNALAFQSVLTKRSCWVSEKDFPPPK